MARIDGETQETLAVLAGVAPHTICRLECGLSAGPSTARKLAEALDVSVADMMDDPPVRSRYAVAEVAHG